MTVRLKTMMLPMDPDAPLLQAVRAKREEACAEDPYAFTLTEVAHFTVVGIPVAQPRARARIVKPKVGPVRVQMTAAQREHPVHQWTACLYEGCMQERPYDPLRGPVGVRLRFFVRAPKDACGMRDGSPYLKRRWPCGARTDLDNLAKPVLDVLTNLGWWMDDGQVVQLDVSKVYAEPNEPSRVDVTVWEVG